MKRVLYLLLLLAACKASSDKEVDRIAEIKEKVLNNDITVTFRPEIFQGDIVHISEATYMEDEAADTYIKKDTILKEYLFKDQRLHQIATVTRRMLNDTLTIQYDTAGRILALINSDDFSTYNADRFKYDTNGRRIEKINRIYSTETRHLYQYKTGDSLLVLDGDENSIESIVMEQKGDAIMVKRNLIKDGKGYSTVDEYNKLNQLVTTYFFFGAVVETKLVSKYDDHGNLIAFDYHQGDSTRKSISDELYKARSFTVEYTYDNKGNWISRKEQAGDKKSSATTTRKITYR
ncbi:hypothetical protein [Chitinophaga sp. CF418]|uniref:hypothetical protein n=1 Tax=Chitinophaga sp. CF418 TaxID=1855287 RepID=UPI00091C1F78|nr:hypothetical protein [Chitinophaga sp. CF418]SHM02727.1 YD repeat-containing protein [Chitinophaga sp. CF418]